MILYSNPILTDGHWKARLISLLLNHKQFERKDMKKSRLLTLFLTDGTESFKAIEYKPISCLSEEILPWTKVTIFIIYKLLISSLIFFYLDSIERSYAIS